MKITVIIPVFNVCEFLDQAIKSALSPNNVKHLHEVIVVDDGSVADKAEEIAEICQPISKVTLYQRSHQGAASAREFGWQKASSELTVLLDADDMLAPDAFEHFVKGFSDYPESIGIYGRVLSVNDCAEVRGEKLPDESWINSEAPMFENILERKVPFCNGSIGIRTNILKGLRVKNHHLKQGEDWMLWCYLALAGRINYLGDRVVMYRRKHAKNITNAGLEYPENILNACQAVFSDPKIRQVLDEEALHKLEERALNRVYASLASGFAANSMKEKAQEYFEKLSQPLSNIVD